MWCADVWRLVCMRVSFLPLTAYMLVLLTRVPDKAMSLGRALQG
jgi:hypothetical protein